jgi:glycosyltransferase involved in cell wall biosynthesis
MKFAIIIGTYQRPDGRTPFFLRRALDSIFAQTHQDFRVYLIGDKYDDEKELLDIAAEYPQEKMYIENLSVAAERDKYGHDKEILWNVVGLALANYCIELILKDGFDYLCHLDHDDYWTPDHLSLLNAAIEKTGTVWVCTKSTHINSYLPHLSTEQPLVEFYPKPCGLIHSSTCINFRKIPLRYRDVYAETGTSSPCDADLWKRCSIYFKEKGLKSYCVNSLTCFHETEGYVRGEEHNAENDLVTGVVVTYNTKGLIKRAYESIRSFHPKMKLIIIDGSSEGDECQLYVESLEKEDKSLEVIHAEYNIGHGRGMCLGIYNARTPYVLFFDSDIQMLKSPIKKMISMMESDTFGVGYIHETGLDGYEYDPETRHKDKKSMKYLHPFFQLVQVSAYKKFHPYVHHGAPCFLTMLDIHNKGLSGKILKQLPGLGASTTGAWIKDYVSHDLAGTRNLRQMNGQPQIEGAWDLGGSSKTITVITPTGDRPEAFELTRRWIASQSRKPDQWLVIDDGRTPLQERLREGCEYVRRDPKPLEGHTLTLNMKKAFPLIKGDIVLIFEDDDWYGHDYIITMERLLRSYDLVGEMCARYYYLPLMKYSRIYNREHASFCQTGFTSKILPFFKECLEGNPYIDIRLWATFKGNKFLIDDTDDRLRIHCSMKGMQGRKGIGNGHDRKLHGYQPDVGLGRLISWVGEGNACLYMDHVGQSLESAKLIQAEVAPLQKMAGGNPVVVSKPAIAHPHPPGKQSNVRQKILRVTAPKPVRIGNRILPPDWR